MSSNNVSGFSSPGGFERTKYDNCAYQTSLNESTSPLKWMMYGGKFENCGKCVFDDKSFYRPFDAKIIDAENELKNITRRSSRCPQHKYSPTCKKSASCTNTFDSSNPIVLPQELCPIVHNNIQRMKGPGYELNTEPFCNRK